MEHNTNNKTSAQGGWQQMKNLLDTEVPVVKNNTSNNKRKYSVLALLLLMLGCGTYQLLQKTDVLITKNEIKNSDSKKQQFITETTTTNTNTSNSYTNQNTTNTKALNSYTNQNTTNTKASNSYTNQKASNTEASNSYTNQNTTNTEASNSYTNQNISNTKASNSYTNQNATNTKASNSYTNQNASNTKASNSYTNQNASNTKASNSYTNQNTTNTKLLNSYTNQSETNTLSFNTTQNNNSTKNTDTTPNQALSDSNVLTKATNTSNKSTTAQSNNNLIKNKKQSQFSYGLEWVLPFAFNNTSFANNTSTAHQILSIVPSVYVAKNITKKSSISIKCNPYAQHILNNISTTHQFVSEVQSASNTTNNANKLLQTISIFKVVGIEINAAYQYNINNHLSTSVGIANTFVSSAMVNDVVIKNGTEKVKDNITSISKSDVNWKNISSNFISTQLSLNYSFKKYNVGVRIVKPITSLYGNNTFPVNYQAVFKFKLK